MPTGLIRRGARYSIRRRIPLDLVDHYGKAEVTRALGTSDPKEARKLLPQVWAALDREFDAARAATGGPSEAEAMPEDPGATSARVIASLRARREQAARTNALDEFSDYVRDELKTNQAVLDGKFDPWMSLTKHEAFRNALRAIATGEGALALPAAASQQVSDSRDGLPLTDLAELWIKHQERPRATIASVRRAVSRFEGVVGKKTVQAVTRKDFTAFTDKMREPGYDTPNGHSIPNMNSMLSLLSALFGYAVRRNLIDINPAANTQIEDPRRAREKRREFDAAALKAIFESRVYANGERPKAGAGEAAYWIPLLALYTGARMNELAQLHPDDVVSEGYSDPKGRKHAAWVLRIEANKARGQKVKTEGSERRIPIHADLIKLGFLDYAQAQKGKALLFDALSTKNADHRLSGAWGQWFSGYLRRTAGVTDPRMTFHSFRHTFKHHARQSLIPDEVHNALTGHETGDAASAYGGLSYPLHPLVEGIKRYRVPGFKLPAPAALAG